MNIDKSQQMKSSKQHLSIKKYDFSILDDKQKQFLNEWAPPSLVKSSIFLFIGAVYLLTMGVICYITNKDLQEHSEQYGKSCKLNEKCQIEFTLKDQIDGPVYLYYEMHQFNQNHKLYLDSFSEEQMEGKELSEKHQCDPYVTNKDMNKTVSLTGEQLDPEAVAIPCGIRAMFLFEDTFKLSKNGQNIAIDEEGVSWEYDRERYKNSDKSKQWADIEDEHFQVWMRPSPLSKFRKLWGKIDQDLQEGKYVMEINNVFNQTYFESEKHFLLGNKSKIGGKNSTLIISHFVTGIALIILGIGLLIQNCRLNSKLDGKNK